MPAQDYDDVFSEAGFENLPTLGDLEGKTVFITALVHALTTGGATPPVGAVSLPGFRAWGIPRATIARE